MARPEKIKTPLGQRLTDVRKALKYETRQPFADLLGLPVETLGGYERGIRVPDAAFMAIYHQRFGVNINWLVTGDGKMFADAPTDLSPRVDAILMERLHDRVSAVFTEIGQKPPPRRITREASNLYNELLTAVSNISDTEMVDATLPKLTLELRRRISVTPEHAGQGKHSASK